MRNSTLSLVLSRRNAFSLVIILAVIAVYALINTGAVARPVSLEGNEIMALTDRDYFPQVSEAFAAASSSIHMLMYNVNYYTDYPDSNVNLLIDGLDAAAARGVDVRIIADEYTTDRPVLTLLKERGINIKYDSKDTTTHAKLIIIDSKIIIIGSTNWSHYALDKNHEANVVVNSPALAAQFEAYFEKIWTET
jgi:phosphatidylserine/phosphatidylglycerophosphate/cardiolipin synthase-like enzyme